MGTVNFYVDFNDMVALPDLVILSRRDTKVDSDGNEVLLFEGMEITVCMDDLDQDGNVDNLIASGVVERNVALDWSKSAKWCCRIDAKGIRPQSEIAQ